MDKIRRFMGLLLISVCFLCILGGCDIIDELRTETSVVDYNEVYNLSDGEYTVMLNNELTDMRAIDDGQGHVYMDVNTANSRFNSRIYWEQDTNTILYATPEGMAEYTPGSTNYTVGASILTSEIPVVIDRDGMLYISMDFIKEEADFLKNLLLLFS